MTFTICFCGKKYPTIHSENAMIFYKEKDLLYDETGNVYTKCGCGSIVNITDTVWH